MTHCMAKFDLKTQIVQCPTLLSAVPGHQQGQTGKYYRLHAANVGAVQLQPGGSDQRANRRAGGGEEQDREASGTAAAKVRTASLKRKLLHLVSQMNPISSEVPKVCPFCI